MTTGPDFKIRIVEIIGGIKNKMPSRRARRSRANLEPPQAYFDERSPYFGECFPHFDERSPYFDDHCPYFHERFPHMDERFPYFDERSRLMIVHCTLRFWTKVDGSTYFRRRSLMTGRWLSHRLMTC